MTLEKTASPTVEQTLMMMEQNLGAEPRPMVLMSKMVPELVLRQASERKQQNFMSPRKRRGLIDDGTHRPEYSH